MLLCHDNGMPPHNNKDHLINKTTLTGRPYHNESGSVDKTLQLTDQGTHTYVIIRALLEWNSIGMLTDPSIKKLIRSWAK